MTLRHRESHDILSLGFLVLGVPCFFPFILMGQIPGPFAGGISDTYVFFEPYALAFTHAILRGENPFWSHASAFGAPTLLTLGTGALHPFHLLHLALPDWLAFAIGWWARIALFSAFLYLYLRRLGARPWIAMFFTLSAAYGSWHINYSLEIIGFVSAFFPMALYYTDRLTEDLKPANFFLLSIAIGCMILGGFLSVVLYFLAVIGIKILCLAKHRRQFVWSTLACIAGVLLVLPAIVETLNFYPQTGYDIERRNWLFHYTPPLSTSFNLVIPSLYGNFHGYSDAGMRDFYGSLLGAGILTTPLAIITSAYYCIFARGASDRRATFWILTLLFCLAAYFNLFNIKYVLQYIPILNQHPLTRLQALVAIASSICAALYIEKILQLRISSNKWLEIISMVGAILFIFYTLAAISIKSDAALINLLLYGTIAAASLGCFYLALTRSSHLNILICITTVTLAGVATSYTYTYYFKQNNYYPESSIIAYIKRNLAPGARILDVSDILFRQTAIAYDVPSLTNHWFTQLELRSLVRELSSKPTTPALTFETAQSLDEQSAWPKLRRLHAQFVTLPYANNRAWIDQGSGTGEWRLAIKDVEANTAVLEVLYNGRSVGKRGLPGEHYNNYQEGSGRITFEPLAPETWITIPVSMHSGWRTVQGATAIRSSSDHFISVLSGSGSKPIVLEYFPNHFYIFVTIGLTFLAIAVFALALDNKRRRQLAAC